MKNRLCMLGCALLTMNMALASDRSSGPRPATTPETLARGQRIFFRRCSFCHGLLGDGNGPAADYLDPRPRDFTLGTFKFRTTQSGELPLDTDLYKTISDGLHGTAMQSFDGDVITNGLSQAERFAVIDYIKTFAPEFSDPDLDPLKNKLVVDLPPADQRAPYNPATVACGAKVFLRAKCWECHGKQGRGNGQKDFDRTDDWGFPIRIRDVTHPWNIKGGSRVEDIYMRLSTGINGTPMPSFVDALKVADRWDLANFIKSLQHQRTTHNVMQVALARGEIPNDPDAPMWVAARPMDVRLAGQVIAAPRWQNPSIDLVTVKALYNDHELAFLLVWDDPFPDTANDDSKALNTTEIRKIGNFNSYVKANDMVPRKVGVFRDSVALQFPIKPVAGTKKPHFFRGDPSHPVNLWIWKADLAAQGKHAVEEATARGWKQAPKAEPKKQQQVTSWSGRDKGRWRVIMRRALTSKDRNDVQFPAGKFIPMALNVWDGSNGEHGLLMSLSSWYYLIMETPTPMSVYVYTTLATLLTGWFGLVLVRRAEGRGTGKPAQPIAAAPLEENT